MAFAPILMGLSAAMSAVGAIAGGNAAGAAADYNAKVAKDNAHTAEVQGFMQSEAAREAGARSEGEAAATIGASGVQSGSGTALETLRESAINTQLDVLAARYTAGSQARAYNAQAAGDKAAASSARIGGYLGAGAALLKGASGIAGGTGALSMPVPGQNAAFAMGADQALFR